MNMRKRLIAGIIVGVSSSVIGFSSIHADAATTTGTTGTSAKAVAVQSSPSFRGRHSHCHRNHGWGRPHRHCGFEDGDGWGDGGDDEE